MANEIQGLDTAGIIRDLKKRRAELDTMIAGLERVYGATSWTHEDGGTASTANDYLPTELPRGAFLGKSLPAAVKLFLSAIKKKQSIREIATALKDGGVESTSDNFENVITGCLNRMKSNGELLRFKDGWGLPEFYPESLRARLSQDGTSKRKPSKNNAKKRVKATKRAKKVATGPSLEQRVEAFARTKPGEWISFKDVMEDMPDLSRQAASSSLARLVKKRGWEKSAEGNYRAGTA